MACRAEMQVWQRVIVENVLVREGALFLPALHPLEGYTSYLYFLV